MKKLLLPCILLVGIVTNAQYNVNQNFDSTLTGVYYFGGGSVTTNSGSCSGALSYTKSYTTSAPEGGVYISPSDLSQSNDGNPVSVSFKLKKTGTMVGKLLLFTRVKNGSTWGNAVYYAVDGSNTNPLDTNINSTVYDCVTFTGTIPASAFVPGTEYGIGVDFYKTSSGSGSLYIDDVNLIQGANLSVSEANMNKTFIYPTPFNDMIKISNLKNVKSITINDSSGRIIKSFLPSSELHVADIDEGIYFINLYMEDGSLKNYKTFKK